MRRDRKRYEVTTTAKVRRTYYVLADNEKEAFDLSTKRECPDRSTDVDEHFVSIELCELEKN